MESLLEKIFVGKADVVEKTINHPEYKNTLAAYGKLRDDLKALLTAEQCDILDELADSFGKLHSIIEKHSFQQGFKLGVGLIFEAFTSKNS